MKKNIKNICILSLILITISTTIILTMGRTYTVSFNNIKNNNSKIEIENKKGEVEILEEKEKNGNYLVKVKAKKEGRVSLLLDIGSIKEIKELYIHKSMIITDNNYFGKSNCSEVIPISLSILLLYIVYLLIKEYKLSKKENL